MVTPVWQSIITVLVALSLFLGCASSPYVGTGALLGGVLGAGTGAAIGNRNPGQGALIGGLIGTVAGAAGGYALQPRPAGQPPQGYYYQQPPGYGAPAPPAYGYNTPAPYGYNRPAPGPAYGYNAPVPGPSSGGAYGGYNTPNPVTPPGGPQYSAAPALPPDSQSQEPQPSSVHTPIIPAPYNNYE